jgi:hypothetical protein
LTGMPVLASGILQGCRFSPGFADGVLPAPPSVMIRRARVREIPKAAGPGRRSPFDMPEWYRKLLERATDSKPSTRKPPSIVRGFW